MIRHYTVLTRSNAAIEPRVEEVIRSDDGAPDTPWKIVEIKESNNESGSYLVKVEFE